MENRKVVVVFAAVIGKLKLTQLSKTDLERRQMNITKGGSSCFCVCTGCLCSSMDNADQVLLDHMTGHGNDDVNIGCTVRDY